MGKNDTLKNLLVAGAVFVLIMALLQQFSPPSAPVGTGDGGGGRVGPPSVVGGAVPSTPGAAPVDGKKVELRFHVIEADGVVARSIGSKPSGDPDVSPETLPYRMGLTLSNVGASVESATLSDHAATIHSAERYTLMSPVKREGVAVYRSLAVEKIRIDGEDVRLDDKKWQVGEVEPYSAKGQEGERVSFSLTVNRRAGAEDHANLHASQAAQTGRATRSLVNDRRGEPFKRTAQRAPVVPRCGRCSEGERS